MLWPIGLRKQCFLYFIEVDRQLILTLIHVIRKLFPFVWCVYVSTNNSIKWKEIRQKRLEKKPAANINVNHRTVNAQHMVNPRSSGRGRIKTKCKTGGGGMLCCYHCRHLSVSLWCSKLATLWENYYFPLVPPVYGVSIFYSFNVYISFVVPLCVYRRRRCQLLYKRRNDELSH